MVAREKIALGLRVSMNCVCLGIMFSVPSSRAPVIRIHYYYY